MRFIFGKFKKNTIKALSEIQDILNGIRFDNNKMKEDISKSIKEDISRETENISQKVNDVYNRVVIAEQNLNTYDMIYKTMTENQYTNLEYLCAFLTEKSQKKILIAGFYGADNLGDEIMLQTLIEKIPASQHKNVTVLLCDNNKYNITGFPAINLLHYPKTYFDYNFLAKHFDVLIWGGGALLDDSQYNKENIGDLGRMVVELSERFILFGKKVAGISLSSSNSFSCPEYINGLTRVLPEFDYFSVRDNYSLELLNKYGINNALLDCDIAFGNNALFTSSQDTTKKDSFEKIKKAGIVWICTEETKEPLRLLIKNTLEMLGDDTEIYLIPFYNYGNNDFNFLSKIKECFPEKSVFVENYTKNTKTICDTLKSMDIVINMRYHSILLCSVLGIKSLNIVYDSHPHYPNKVHYLSNLFDIKENTINLSELPDNYSKIKCLKAPCKRNSLYENTTKKIEQILNKYLGG